MKFFDHLITFALGLLASIVSGIIVYHYQRLYERLKRKEQPLRQPAKRFKSLNPDRVFARQVEIATAPLPPAEVKESWYRYILNGFLRILYEVIKTYVAIGKFLWELWWIRLGARELVTAEFKIIRKVIRRELRQIKKYPEVKFLKKAFSPYLKALFSAYEELKPEFKMTFFAIAHSIQELTQTVEKKI